MFRIALISMHASPLAVPGSVDSGGQNIYVAQLARNFAAAGHMVDVYTRKDSPSRPDCLAWKPGVSVIHIEAGPQQHVAKEQLLAWLPEFQRGLCCHVLRQQLAYDVVHGNFFMSAMAGLQLVRLVGCPLVVTFHALGKVRRMHQQKADAFPGERISMETEIVRAADCIVAECPQDHHDLVSLYGADPDSLRIVPCGYDPAEMQPCAAAGARRQLGWGNNHFHVLQLGRLVPRKGIDTVIRAVSRLRERYQINARLCVVGGDKRDMRLSQCPELRRLQALCASLGLEEAVEFTGWRSRMEIASYYCASDVFVTMPWYEPFGITPVEAMACARPVIGSDTGGIKTTVIDGLTGFIVPPRDAGALAGRLALLAANPWLRTRLGKAGLRRAQEKFTWKRVAGELLEIYGNLCISEQRQKHNIAGAGLAFRAAAHVL